MIYYCKICKRLGPEKAAKLKPKRNSSTATQGFTNSSGSAPNYSQVSVMEITVVDAGGSSKMRDKLNTNSNESSTASFLTCATSDSHYTLQ